MTPSRSPESELARRLLAGEPDARDAAAAANSVLRRLHEHLALWFGDDGSRALLSRALDQTRDSHPSLANARIERQGDQVLVGLPERTGEPGEAQSLVALIAAVLSLLTRLIGADMLVRILRQAWPERMPGDLERVAGEMQHAARLADTTLAREEPASE